MTKENKKIVSILFKTAILVFAFAFIFYKLNNNANLHNFRTLITGLSAAKAYSTLSVVFLLMLLNWFLEALKWKYLVSSIENISVWRAVESVFCGLTLAVFTPNRIGEYGGRVFFLSAKRRILGIVAMGVGAVGQMVVTNVAGALAILWFIYNFVEMDVLLFYAISFLVLIFCCFFILFYFHIRWFLSFFERISFLQKFHKFFSFLSRYRRSHLLKIFVYCLSRFTVFTSQYYLIINLLIPEMAIFPMVMMVFILFFIQSALPSLDLLDVGVRTMTATYFFAFITSHELAIMAATACIWLINLIIPAILGASFVFKLNFFGTNNN